MYLTKFAKVNNTTENYFYQTPQRALRHLMQYARDDSGRYRYIAVLDHCGRTVLALLQFVNGKPLEVITAGCMVKLKRSYAGEDELKYVYEVSNINEITGRIDITCVNSGMAIRPTETVGVEMVERYTGTIEPVR